MLLKANPEAAKYCDSDTDNDNLLHSAAQQGKMPLKLCIDVMQRILAIHKDAVQEVNVNGWLPVHYAVKVMEFLLGLYPESASVFTTDGLFNLLRLTIMDTKNIISGMEAKVRFLCSRYPAMIPERDNIGWIPLHCAVWIRNTPAAQILCETDGQEQVRTSIVYPTDANRKRNGWLPLHLLINRNIESLRNSLFSKEADFFRMLLRWYPEAVGIEAGIGVAYKKTPYQLAIDGNLPPYYLRLLLRAAPDLNPAEFHRLNYEERRMAMFLTFKARTSATEPPLLARLRFEKKDLVKRVIFFLLLGRSTNK